MSFEQRKKDFFKYDQEPKLHSPKKSMRAKKKKDDLKLLKKGLEEHIDRYSEEFNEFNEHDNFSDIIN